MSEPDVDVCPGCGGPADNGFDRCVPPSPYYCRKCSSPGQPSPEPVRETGYEAGRAELQAELKVCQDEMAETADCTAELWRAEKRIEELERALEASYKFTKDFSGRKVDKLNRQTREALGRKEEK